MNRVEEVAGLVDEGAEVHDLPFGSADIFDGDHPTHHPDFPAEMPQKIPRHHLPPEAGLEQVEHAHRNRKAQQLDLVVGILDGRIVEYRHLEALVLGREHAGRMGPDGHLPQVELRLPQEGTFVGFQGTKGPQPYQDYQLLLADGNPVDEFVDGAVISVAFSFAHDQLDGDGLEVLHVDKSHEDGGADDPGMEQAPVDAGQLDGGALPLCLVEVDPGVVEPAEIVDHCHHELEGMVRLEIETLEALHGIGGRMGLREGVAGEGFNLPPYLPGQLVGMAHLPAIGKVLLFYQLELPERPELPRHRPPQYIGIRQIESGKMVGHLDHIFLEHHHTIGLAQLLFQDGMEVGEVVGMVKPFDVFAHHPRLGHSWPDDRAGRHQADVVVAPELFQQSAHGGTFDVKTADGLALLQLPPHLRIRKEPVDLVDIDLFAPILHDDLHRLLDVADPALAEDIQFLESHLFGDVHVPLGGEKPLGRHVQSTIIGDGLLCHEHAAGVYRPHVGKIEYLLAQRSDHIGRLVVVVAIAGIVHQQVDLLLRQAKHLTQLPDDRLVAEGGGGAEQGRMVLSVPFEDVVLHLVAVLPREIDVEIGRTGPLGIEKPFEIEVELDGIHVGDAQAVGHDAVGSAPPPHMVKSPRHAVMNHVPGDQEIGGEAEVVDDLQLVFDSFLRGLVVFAVAVEHPVVGQFLQKQPVVLLRLAVGALVLAHLEFDVDGTLLHQPLRVLDDLGIVLKNLPQLPGYCHHLVGIGELVGQQLAQQGVVVDGPQAFVDQQRFVVEEGDGLPDHQFLGVITVFGGDKLVDLVGSDAGKFIVGQCRTRHLPEGIDHECLAEFRGLLLKFLPVQVMQREVFVQLPEPLPIFGNRDEEQFVPIPELHPRNGFDASLLRLFDKLRNAHGGVDVRQYEGGYPLDDGLIEQLVDAHGAVAEAVVGVGVEVHGEVESGELRVES